MDNLSPSNDTLANDDDAHKSVMCTRSTFLNTNNFKLNMIWKILVLSMVLLQISTTLTRVLCVLGAVLHAPSSRPAIFLHKFIVYDMENLSPSNDTLANDNDAHNAVMCSRSSQTCAQSSFFRCSVCSEHPHQDEQFSSISF